MSDVQSRERSPETASGAQREPDERVREALEQIEYAFDHPEAANFALLLARDELRRLQAAQREPVAWPVEKRNAFGDEVVRWLLKHFGVRPYPEEVGALLDAFERLPYTHPQRDDHPTEGLLREARDRAWKAHVEHHGVEVMKLRPDLCSECKWIAKLDAAIAASKGTPDSMGHGQPLPSLSVVAQWQPIVGDMSELGGEVVLVGAENEFPRVACRRLGGGWNMVERQGGTVPYTPTHWMRVPDVRSQAKGKP